MAERTRACMYVGTRRKATSTRQWSWPSITRLIASVWLLMPLTASCGSRASVGTPRRSSATRRLLAAPTPTSMESIALILRDGDGRSSGGCPLFEEQERLRQQIGREQQQ